MSNAHAMTDQPTQDVPAGPNLMILKGVVWGLGFLLLIGFAVIALMIARGPRTDSVSERIEIPLAEGEAISSTDIAEGRLFAVVTRGGLPHRIMIIDMRTNAIREIPVSVTVPVTEQ